MTPAAIIEPCATDPTTPPTQTGQVVTVDATSQGVRPIAAATELPYGITTRAYPTQMAHASGYFGAAGFGTANPFPLAGDPRQAVDVGRMGYFLMPVVGATKKGGRVHVWVAAAGGAHFPGGLEAAATVGSTISLGPGTTFNGVPDANQRVEVAWNVGQGAVTAD